MILASKSVARAKLLRIAGLTFTQCDSRVDEDARRSDLIALTPQNQAVSLARMKAENVRGDLVIGADQILEFNGQILHKPDTLDRARERLRSLCGNTHCLHTAVAVCQAGADTWSHVETARLTMYDAPDHVLEKIYAAEGQTLMSSPGAYRLEGPAVRLFSSLCGDYFSILGLPLLPLLAELRRRSSIS